jgi:hypothetical protein
VITTGPGVTLSHVFHPPIDCLSWLVIAKDAPCSIQQFETLRDVLSFIWPAFS